MHDIRIMIVGYPMFMGIDKLSKLVDEEVVPQALDHFGLKEDADSAPNITFVVNGCDTREYKAAWSLVESTNGKYAISNTYSYSTGRVFRPKWTLISVVDMFEYAASGYAVLLTFKQPFGSNKIKLALDIAEDYGDDVFVVQK